MEKKKGRSECAEIGNMTRSGRCFKPDHLRTTEGPRKEESSREKDPATEAFHKALKKPEYNVAEQLNKIPAHIPIVDRKVE